MIEVAPAYDVSHGWCELHLLGESHLNNPRICWLDGCKGLV